MNNKIAAAEPSPKIVHIYGDVESPVFTVFLSILVVLSALFEYITATGDKFLNSCVTVLLSVLTDFGVKISHVLCSML